MKIVPRSIPPVALSLTLLAIATTAVVYSPTLYRMFCEATGYGGTVSVTKALKPEQNGNVGPEVAVRFDANISPGLGWEFEPEQRQVKTHIGVPTTVYYRAKNISDHTIVGRATYNVTPDSAGYYFNKTECFCFTEQKLEPGESADMPIVFFLDQEMMEDIDTKSIRTITLSYTFFRQDSDEEAIAAAKPLREESEARAKALETAETAEFSNHTLRPQ
ncbi:cytochrome c oxidase assembly protein [Parvibaculum sp.]|uniref:cytochrome c oxidase assembly protein n=1 Tax=Parvibaculum sp. TaxID=2024848 RepID=UPI0032974318